MLAGAPLIAFVHVTDTEPARRFYVDTLGLELVEETPFALVLRSGATMVRVTPVEGHVPLQGTVLGWEVADIAATLDELAGRGVAALRYDFLEQDARGAWLAPGGAKVAWFADPDGNTLSVTQF